MSGYNHFRNIRASLLRFCSDFKEAMALEGETLVAVNLDDFTDESQWPKDQDFIGLSELHMDIEEFYSVQCMLAVSTAHDKNLDRMTKLMHHLLDRVLPNSCIPVYDADTGDEVGALFVGNGVRVGSPLPTKTQPIQPVALRLLSNLTSIE